MTRKSNKGVPGDFFEINLAEDGLCYGRVLESDLAFYGKAFATRPALEDIAKTPVIFRIWVMDYALKKRVWTIIGNLPVEPELRRPQQFYIQDVITKQLFFYNPNPPHKRIPASFEECQGVEVAAAWEPQEVEERLRDFLHGRKSHLVDELEPPGTN